VRCVALLLLAIIQLDSGWRIAVTAPRESPPGDDVAWSQQVAERRELDLWYRNRLPERLPDDPQIVFRAYIAHFALYVDQQRIHTFDDDTARDRMRVHVVPLPPRSAGKRVYVRVVHPEGDPYFGDGPLIVARAELPDALHRETATPLRDDLDDIAIGGILLVVGLITIAASQIVRRGEARTLLYFGLMAALYGARLLADCHFPYALGIRARNAIYATAWITYVINIPGWALARRLIGEGWKSSLRWQLYAFIVFAPIAIGADLVLDRAGSLESANNVLVVIGGVNIVFNLLLVEYNVLRSGRWWSAELRVMLGGSLIFMLLALANNLSSLRILPWRDVDEKIGFLAFVGALGFAATRSFLRGERARVALDNELQTAREIQRSILPTSMPDIAGLRFHALYDPASSVAGDLYEFLRVDGRRCGALVADVSGHGVPAALIASMVKIAVSSQSRCAANPAALLGEVNRTLRGEVRRVFVTATYLYFDMERRSVEVSNAGHPSPLLHRGGEVRELGPHGVVLGRFDATYASESTDLQPGDRIVAYTDGVVEALNARGEAFGEERLQAMIRGGASAEDIARDVRQWRDERSETDDVTLLVVDVVA